MKLLQIQVLVFALPIVTVGAKVQFIKFLITPLEIKIDIATSGLRYGHETSNVGIRQRGRS